MNPISFDGIAFSTLGVDPGILSTQSSAPRRALIVDRPNATPMYSGFSQAARNWYCEFSTASDIEATMATLMGALDFTNPAPRTMVCDRNDDTRVSCQMVPLTYQWIDANAIEVVFAAMDEVWRAVTPTSLSVSGITTTTQIPLVNDGGAKAWPLVKLGYSANRSSEDVTVGWKYKREIPITNGSTEDWIDEPIWLDLDDTAAWVTGGKAQADGDDVRIIYQGRNLPRELVNMNTKRTLCATLVSAKRNKSVTLEVWYGNPDATAPDDLSTRTGTEKTYIAPDTESYNGTATAGTTTTMTDSGAAWETDRWAGSYLLLLSGTGSVRYRRIASNTGTVLTLNRALATAPDATTKYAILSSGMFFDGGRVTSRTANSITDNAHTRKWGTNQLKGATVQFVGGSGATPATMTVASNTTDTITFTGSFSVNPSVNDSYNITRYGVYQYVVDTAHTETAHRGVRHINRYYEQPGVIRPVEDVPGAWGIDTYLENQDDYAVFAPYNTGSGGGHAQNWWPNIRIRRRVGQEAGYKDEGNGDGMSVRTPQGLQGIYFDYQMQAESGLCDVIMAVRERTATDWTVAVTDTTTRPTLADVAAQYVDLSAYNNPTRLGFFVVPADDAQEIPSSSTITDDAEFRTLDYLELYLDTGTHTALSSNAYTVGSEVGIYDAQFTVRYGGGSTPDEPYERAQFGGDKHWIGLESGERLWLRTDPDTTSPIISVYNSSDVLQYRAPWAAVADRYEEDQDGSAQAQVQGPVFGLRPFQNLLGTSQDRVTGWTLTNGSGVSSTIANASSPDFDGNSQSIRVNVTATPAGAWTIELESALISLTPGELYEFGAAFYRSGMGASITGKITANWMTGLASAIVDSPTSATRTLASATTWYTMGGGLRVADYSGLTTQTDGVIMVLEIAGSGSMTGDVYIDLVTLGGAHLLHISEAEQGTLTAAVEWSEGFYG